MSTFKDKPLKKCHTDNRKMIDDIHHELIDSMTEEERCEYYLENGLLLDEYYSKRENEKDISGKEGILNFFKKENDNNNDKNDNLSKKKIHNLYLSNIDDSILNNTFHKINIDKCIHCSNKFYYNEIEGCLICESCGYSENILIFNERGSYNDPPREANYFAYKRINHFNEWLAQFQAKGTTELPDTIYQDIFLELHKNKNYDISKLHNNLLRDLLKKLNYNKYYEHIPHLINVLSGKDPPTLSRKSEEILRSLFKEIQIPFMNHCPPNRKNFLSYSYVLHKFCELLEYDELLIYFPLLKSREKLQQQDQIWKAICKDLQWEYIPSI